MQVFLALLSIPFLYINYKIIYSDIIEKKIPNKYLGYLLLLIPFYYIYIFFNFDINIGLFFLKFFSTFIISFILYSFGIWSAGDAKYLLVLGLFIPNIGIIPFISNIALLALFYLLSYFIYFYSIKLIFNKKYRNSLWSIIYIDHKDKINVYLEKGNEGYINIKYIIYKFLKGLLFFITLFIIIRLTRIYLIQDLKDLFISLNGNKDFIKDFLANYITYFALVVIILTFLLFYIFRLLYSFLFKIFNKYIIIKWLKINISKKDLGFGFLLIIIFLLIYFIIYEYITNGIDIFNKLYLICTLYLFLYIIFKIIFYSYKITFQISEYDYINIDNLKEGEIIDKNYLINLFGTQASLGFEKDVGILSPDPNIYFKNIENPINKEEIEKLKNIYQIVNNYHKENNTNGFEKINNIKILKTFAFGGYIFTGFIITFFIQDKLFKYIFNILFDIIKNFYN